MFSASQSRVLICVAVLVAVSHVSSASAQERWTRGQNIQPVFEGWEHNADGSFDMVFGYLNRNYEEQPVVPVGANNSFAPDPPTGDSLHTSTRDASSSSSGFGCRPTGVRRTSCGP